MVQVELRRQLCNLTLASFYLYPSVHNQTLQMSQIGSCDNIRGRQRLLSDPLNLRGLLISTRINITPLLITNVSLVLWLLHRLILEHYVSPLVN